MNSPRLAVGLMSNTSRELHLLLWIHRLMLWREILSKLVDNNSFSDTRRGIK